MAFEALTDVEQLESYLASRAPGLGVQKVEGIARFPAGLSSLSCRIDIKTEAGPGTLVLRAEPEHGVIPPYDIVAEFGLLGRISEAGLPVPAALHLEEDPGVLGTRFMIMSYVEGDVYRSFDPRLDADPVMAQRVRDRFVEMLARIHLEAPTAGLPEYRDTAEAARGLVAVCRKRLADTEILPTPLLVAALDVLDRYAPEGDRLVLLHGDYRLPNLKWRDGEIVGILDWELARAGDPVSDLAFTQTIGAGPCAINGDLLDRYRELTGFEVDEGKVAYYQLLEMVKGTIIGLAAASDLVSGGSDLRLLSVAGLAAAGVPIVAMLQRQLDSVEGRR